ncbi:MAG TPA: hypothetical protein VH593_31695 [Ktedonobacteraceae bacterium]|jgi:hypothetical protein
MHLLKAALKNIISVVTGTPQGGFIPGFPLMFHMPYAQLERPVPVWVFFACIPVIPIVVMLFKMLDVLVLARKKKA